VAGLLRQFPLSAFVPFLRFVVQPSAVVQPRRPPTTRNQTHATLPSRGPRPGGPSDDSPARERWVPSPLWTPSPGRGDRTPSPTNARVRSRLHRPTTPRNTKRISRKASKPPRGPSSPIWNPAASTGLKSARIHFTSDVSAERQTHGPGLLRVFASSREPSLWWNEISREAAKNGLPFECDGWPLWPLYGSRCQLASDPPRTPLPPLGQGLGTATRTSPPRSMWGQAQIAVSRNACHGPVMATVTPGVWMFTNSVVPSGEKHAPVNSPRVVRASL
jgi:hypothetical protein